MTTKLTEGARGNILEFIQAEAELLQKKAAEVAAKYWGEAEAELMQETGWGELVKRRKELEETINKLHNELRELDRSHPLMNEMLTPEDYLEMGFDQFVREYDRHGRHDPNVVPHIFQQRIETQWHKTIYMKLDAKMHISEVFRRISSVGHAVARDLTLAGTHEEARTAYDLFYELLKRSTGPDTPPLLKEITDAPLTLPEVEAKKLELLTEGRKE